MSFWPWLALGAAAILAAVWIATARTIIRLRSEFVRLHPVTGQPLPPDALEGLPTWPGAVEVRLGDRVERIRFAGSLVRQWDRLSARERRRLGLRHAACGVGALVLAILAMIGLLAA